MIFRTCVDEVESHFSAGGVRRSVRRPHRDGQEDESAEDEVESALAGEVAAHRGDLPAVRAAGQGVVQRVELHIVRQT